MRIAKFKKIGFCAAALGFLMSLLHEGAWAQQVIPLPELVVTATRLPDIPFDPFQVPAHVTVITEEEIKRSGARTVQEVLQQQPGVVFSDSIGNAFQQTIDLRGFNGQPVTTINVFVDGVKVNEPDFNQVNFDLIPLEDVERIEIVPGTSTIFGKDALAGVISIVTKRGRVKREATGELSFGSFGRQRYTLRTGGSLEGFDYYVGTTRELEEGFRDESDGRATRLLGKFGYRSGPRTDIALSYIHVNDRLKQAGSLPLSELALNRQANFSPGDFSDTLLNMVALNVHQGLPLGFSLTLNSFFRKNDLESFVVGRTSTALNQTGIDSGGGTLQLSQEAHVLGRHNVLTVGAEYTRNEFEAKASSAFVGFPPFLEQRSTNEDLIGFYLQDSFDLTKALSLIASFRYDSDQLDLTDELDPQNSGKRSFSRLSPRAGLVFNPLRDLGVYFSYAEGFRAPTVLELFTLGPFGSNPDLRPVRSRNFEAGARARVGRWLEGSLAFFRTDVKDEIFFVTTDPINLFGRNENIDRTRRQGIELSLKTRYRDLLEGFVNYTLTKTTFQTDLILPAVTTPSFLQEVQKGDEFPLVPRHRLSAGMSSQLLKGLTLSLTGLYTSGQFLLGDEANNQRKLRDYFVLNGRIAYEIGNFTAFFTGNNLLNNEYSTFGIFAINPKTGSPEPFLVPAPDFHVFGGISYRFSY